MSALIEKDGSRSFIVSGNSSREVIKTAHMEALWMGGLRVSQNLTVGVFEFGMDEWNRPLFVGVGRTLPEIRTDLTSMEDVSRQVAVLARKL